MADKTPPLLVIAYILTGSGILLLCSLLLFSFASCQTKGLCLIGTGLCCFGIGEILNHPKKEVVLSFDQEKPASPHYHRLRNSCSLGNLLVIFALLLFFVGISSLLYGR